MWSPQCLRELMTSLSIVTSDMTGVGVQVGIWLEIEDPLHLNRGMEDVDLMIWPLMQ